MHSGAIAGPSNRIPADPANTQLASGPTSARCGQSQVAKRRVRSRPTARPRAQITHAEASPTPKADQARTSKHGSRGGTVAASPSSAIQLPSLALSQAADQDGVARHT